MIKSNYKDRIREYEKHIRHFLIYFCCFIIILSSVLFMTGHLFRQNLFLYLAVFVCLGLLALPLKKWAYRLLADFYEEEWGDIQTRDDFLSLEIARVFGVFVLYYLTQLGIIMLIAPNFYHYKIHGVQIYTPVFFLINLIVYMFYKSFIFKNEWNWNDRKEDNR